MNTTFNNTIRKMEKSMNHSRGIPAAIELPQQAEGDGPDRPDPILLAQGISRSAAAAEDECV